jgi:acyl-CoA thioesterase FadM
MNLFFRLIWILLFSKYREKCNILGPCLTPFICWPTDLDVLRHMNNGRYLSILDLGRVDLLMRAGLADKIRNNKWYPVVVAETIRFKKSLKTFDQFFVETTVLGWDNKAFILQQRFLKNNECYAEAIIKARFLKAAGGSVSPAAILALSADSPAVSPVLPEWIQAWNLQNS